MSARAWTRRTKRGVAAGAAAFIILGGVAWGAIPGADGTIKGCYAKTSGIVLGVPHSRGDVRVVDSAESCRSYETAISWNQKGPKGDPGPAGPAGPAGADAGRLFATVAFDGTLLHGTAIGVTKSSNPGSYEVRFNRQVASCSPVVTIAGITETFASAQIQSTNGTVDPDVVLVNFLHGQTQVDRTFHLVVMC